MHFGARLLKNVLPNEHVSYCHDNTMWYRSWKIGAMRRLPEVKLMQWQNRPSVTLQNSETTKLSNLLRGSGRSRWDREKSRRRTWVSEERKSTSAKLSPTGSDVEFRGVTYPRRATLYLPRNSMRLLSIIHIQHYSISHVFPFTRDFQNFPGAKVICRMRLLMINRSHILQSHDRSWLKKQCCL